MANSAIGNPWILDTAGVITTKPFKVLLFEWTPTTDGHDILIHDNGGNVIWTKKALAADANQGISYTRVGGSVNGINLVTIDGGTLYVYQ